VSPVTQFIEMNGSAVTMSSHSDLSAGSSVTRLIFRRPSIHSLLDQGVPIVHDLSQFLINIVQNLYWAESRLPFCCQFFSSHGFPLAVSTLLSFTQEIDSVCGGGKTLRYSHDGDNGQSLHIFLPFRIPRQMTNERAPPRR